MSWKHIHVNDQPYHCYYSTCRCFSTTVSVQEGGGLFIQSILESMCVVIFCNKKENKFKWNLNRPNTQCRAFIST